MSTSRGGRGGLPYERDENASWKTELYSKSYQLGRGLATYDLNETILKG